MATLLCRLLAPAYVTAHLTPDPGGAALVCARPLGHDGQHLGALGLVWLWWDDVDDPPLLSGHD